MCDFSDLTIGNMKAYTGRTPVLVHSQFTGVSGGRCNPPTPNPMLMCLSALLAQAPLEMAYGRPFPATFLETSFKGVRVGECSDTFLHCLNTFLLLTLPPILGLKYIKQQEEPFVLGLLSGEMILQISAICNLL